MKDKEIGMWRGLYLSSPKSSLVSLDGILLSWKLMQNIFLILCDNPDIELKPSQTYEDSQAFCSVLYLILDLQSLSVFEFMLPKCPQLT